MTGGRSSRRLLERVVSPAGLAAPLLAALVPFLGGLIACAGTADRAPSEFPGTVGVPGPDTLVGTVRQVGNLPFARTVVRGEEGTAAVEGPYEPELRRLVGAEVLVSGERVRGEGPGPVLRVTSYEIRSVDGERPHVGLLRREGEAYRLEGPEGAVLPLAYVPEELAAALGARVWVLTDGSGGVYRYGVLRPPSGEGAPPP